MEHQTSLNDQVLQEPDLTNKLVGVLTRFRQEKTALMADIESTFHQVRVRPENRDILWFLWWNSRDLNSTPEVYRMCVHLFGGVWSPSCCNFVLRKTAEDNQTEFDQDTLDTIKRNFYVNDCLKSTTSEDQAIQLVQNLCQRL